MHIQFLFGLRIYQTNKNQMLFVFSSFILDCECPCKQHLRWKFLFIEVVSRMALFMKKWDTVTNCLFKVYQMKSRFEIKHVIFTLNPLFRGFL